jgi:hypothetical protein
MTYIGEADVNIATSENKWRITRVDETVTDVVSVFYPRNIAKQKQSA